MQILKNDRVKVDYTSASRTEFSGNKVTGIGTVDLCEDGYVMGRLDSGMTFMCNVGDCEVMEEKKGKA